jgi:uracil-DNA glycosylase
MSLKRKDPPTSVTDAAKKPKKNADLTSFFGAPKVTVAKNGGGLATSTAHAKFDKDKWVASLKPETRELLKLEIDTLDPSWLKVLKDEITTPGFLNLKRFLQKEVETHTVYPPMEHVYSW